MRGPKDGGPDPADGPDAVRAKRIVPVVRDARSALRAPLPDRLALTPRTKATVQHALLRGIEITSQPEEGEVLGEPLPSREDRRAISFHEAAEGGGRRPRPPHRAFRRLGRPPARAVLELMHVHGLDEAIAAGDPAILTDDAEANCARGRYRCLLSCFNQPDHELIDRTDEEAKHELLGIARGRVTRRAGGCDAAVDDPWTDAFQRHRLPEPTPGGLSVGAHPPWPWRIHYLAAGCGPLFRGRGDRGRGDGLDACRTPERSLGRRPRDHRRGAWRAAVMTAAFSPGDLVRARGREWVALPSPHEGWPALRPLSGADGERVLLRPDLELDPVRPARFDPPADAAPAMRATAALLAGAVRLALRRRAGPFRSAAQLGFEPRLCQLPALLIALRLAAPRLPIGDAVGIGNTIEARLIPDECRGMQGGRDLHAARPLGFDDMVDKAGTASRRARAKQLT